MQLQFTLPILMALSATIASASAAIWNDELKVWTIGAVKITGHSVTSADRYPEKWPARCDNVPEGGYACGSYEEKEVDAFRAIYRCKEGWLELVDTCHEGDRFSSNRCVKNGRRKGKRFYPFVSAHKVVCVKDNRL